MEQFAKTINRYGDKPDFSAIASRIDFDKYVKPQSKSFSFPFRVAIPIAAALAVIAVAVPIGMRFSAMGSQSSAPSGNEVAVPGESSAAMASVAINPSTPVSQPEATYDSPTETAIMATYTYQGTLNEDDLGELIPQEPSVINPYAAFGTSVSIYHLLGSDSYLSIAVKDGESIALYELDMSTAMELLRDYGFADLEFIAGVNDPTKAYFSNGNQVYDLTESEIQAVRSALKSMTSSYSVRLGSLNGGEWTLAFEEDVDRLECQYYPAKDLIKVGQSIFFDELGTIKALLASKAA